MSFERRDFNHEIEQETNQVEHNLAEKHVLESLESSSIVGGRVSLKSLEEVGVAVKSEERDASGRRSDEHELEEAKERYERSLVVLVLSVQDTTLHVELSLEEWRAVDRVGSSSSGGQGSLREERDEETEISPSRCFEEAQTR